MKFHLVKIGSRFLFEGESYIKVTALVSEHAHSGKRRFIRKAADVHPEASAPRDAEPRGRRPAIPGDQVLSAVTDYHRQAQACLRDVGELLGEQRHGACLRQLDAAHRTLLRQLRLTPNLD